jgi:hypothetical protein
MSPFSELRMLILVHQGFHTRLNKTTAVVVFRSRHPLLVHALRESINYSLVNSLRSSAFVSARSLA